MKTCILFAALAAGLVLADSTEAGCRGGGRGRRHGGGGSCGEGGCSSGQQSYGYSSFYTTGSSACGVNCAAEGCANCPQGGACAACPPQQGLKTIQPPQYITYQGFIYKYCDECNAKPIKPEAKPAAGAKLIQPAIDNSIDALDVVNLHRAARGLPPFIKCPGLTQAAIECVRHRARHRIVGHSGNDFAFVPVGYTATATGAEGEGWPVGSGWGTCCTYENHQYAGAAWVAGDNGHQFMQLYVRN